MDQCKWGIIGTSDKVKAFEEDLHFAKYPHVLQAIVYIDKQQLTETTDKYIVFDSLQQLIESDVDVIYIASPYNQHYTQVRQCLLKGKHVLCERPIAQSADELSRLIQLSMHNHTFMMEAMWIRFLPSIKKMLSVISSGTIGEILSVKASLSYKAAESGNLLQHSGRVLFELGIYPVFLCTLLLGRPEYVQATGNIKEGSDDFFSAFLSFENGQYGFIEVTELPRTNSLAVITGSKGVLQIKNPWGAKPEGIEVDFFDGTKVLHKSEWQGRGLQFELDEVYESLQEDAIESQLYCHNFSLDVMQTMDDIKEQLHLLK